MLSVADVQRRAEELGLNPKPSAKGFSCYCPVHGDKKTRHLYVAQGHKVSVTFRCFKGCPFAEIAAAMGIERQAVGAAPTTRVEGDLIVHDYRDEMWRLLFQVCRKGSGQGKKIWQRRPGPGPSEWINNLEGVRKVLYRLPELLGADPELPVLLGEGEKVAEMLARSGGAGTTNPMGAKSWQDNYADALIGRRVALFLDQDRDGLHWSKEVHASLTRRAIPHAVVDLPGLVFTENHGQDADDWVRKLGHRPEELLELALEALPRPVQFSTNGTGPGHHAEATEPEPWEEPVELAAAELPAFPVHVLPPWLREYVLAVSVALSVPADACALFALACVAVACQKRVEVRIRPDWREPLSLWVLIVLPPANRKSQFFQLLWFPLREHEQELAVLMEPEIASAKAEHRIVSGRLKKLEDLAIKAKTEFQRDEAEKDAIQLAVRLEQMKVPAEPRLLVNDATPERLGMMLQDNGGRIAVMSPEGDVFEMMAGRYSNGQSNLGLYLAGHSGDDFTVDRVNRPPVNLTRTAISFGLTVQPDVLAGFAAKPQFRGRGLLGRFLYAVPESLLGSRPAYTPAIPAAMTERYQERLRSLLAIAAWELPDGKTAPQELQFDVHADAILAEIQDWIEPRLGRWGDLHSMTDWAGKLAGHTARIAALLHLAELAGVREPCAIPVTGESMQGAREIAEYLIPHAQAAFAQMAADPARAGAAHILAWLQKNPYCRFTRRNLHRRLIGTFPRVEEMDESLAVLMQHGFVRRAADEGPKRTGPKTITFDVHPKLAGEGGELPG